ncbi:MAG: HAD-IIIC family phosphatase [Ruminiclostridium sp.]
MKVFEYPFDSAYILKKQRSLKKELLSDKSSRIKKKIAILTGSTADAVKDILELFLLNYGIEPEFYLSEYGQYYEEGLFPSETLTAFKPDIVYIHTTCRNITEFPEIGDSEQQVTDRLSAQFGHFKEVWESLREKFGCTIIQNNFELPPFRLLGNSDCSDIHGRVNFVNRLNLLFADYARENQNLCINDINYLSACYGLDSWQDSRQWYMYKYALSMNAVPTLAANIAAIIKALLGKNKKVLALDLDNTLWGGVVGDDGVDGISIGKDLPGGQVYSEFQEYVKLHKDIGVVLTVCSKNDYENAAAGLNHPDGTLKEQDFTVIKANWENKDRNLLETAEELNLLAESFVFADDNPAERAIAAASTGAAVPEMEGAENYIRILDRNRYFEVIRLSEDDRRRGEMYKENAQRAKQQKEFGDYGEFLDSLQMKAEIQDFTPLYLQRITQLTNKSNQFNVTTRRYTESEMEQVYKSPEYIRLYGKLIDKFGDNGVVSVVIGRIKEKELHIDLWLMSCRVLKREMELAMLDRLVYECRKKGIEKIYGYYYPTAKNGMVKELFGSFGFTKISDREGNTVWELPLVGYENKTRHIAIGKDV